MEYYFQMFNFEMKMLRFTDIRLSHYQLQLIYNVDARRHGIIKTYIPQVALAMHYYPSTAPLNFVFDPELQAGEVGRKEKGEENYISLFLSQYKT